MKFIFRVLLILTISLSGVVYVQVQSNSFDDFVPLQQRLAGQIQKKGRERCQIYFVEYHKKLDNCLLGKINPKLFILLLLRKTKDYLSCLMYVKLISLSLSPFFHYSALFLARLLIAKKVMNINQWQVLRAVEQAKRYLECEISG